MSTIRQNPSIKLFLNVIGIVLLSLFLLIPKSAIYSLVSERMNRSEQVVNEVSATWGGSQQLGGPILTVPIRQAYTFTDDGNIKTEYKTYQLVILPKSMNSTINCQSQEKYRGIYRIPLYHAEATFNGQFDTLEKMRDWITKSRGIETEVQWEKAQVHLLLSDNKGLQKVPKLELGNQVISLHPEPFVLNDNQNYNALSGDIDLGNWPKLDFNYTLDINGSRRISILPLGDESTISITGDWGTPSFDGDFSNINEVNSDSFTARWSVLAMNREYPSFWISDQAPKSINQDVGVKQFKELTNYHLIERCVKYAILIILMTFGVFFFMELLNKADLSLFHYLLAGLNVLVFTLLLLAFSEQIGFDKAYWLAALASSILAGFFLFWITNEPTNGLIVGLLSLGSFSFLYFTLKSEEYALVFGAIGCFLVLATAMYLSKNINPKAPAVLSE